MQRKPKNVATMSTVVKAVTCSCASEHTGKTVNHAQHTHMHSEVTMHKTISLKPDALKKRFARLPLTVHPKFMVHRFRVVTPLSRNLNPLM